MTFQWDVELTIGATGGGDYLQYEERDPPPRPLHSVPEGPPYPRLGTPLVKLPTAPPTTSSDGHEIELSEFSIRQTTHCLLSFA